MSEGFVYTFEINDSLPATVEFSKSLASYKYKERYKRNVPRILHLGRFLSILAYLQEEFDTMLPSLYEEIIEVAIDSKMQVDTKTLLPIEQKLQELSSINFKISHYYMKSENARKAALEKAEKYHHLCNRIVSNASINGNMSLEALSKLFGVEKETLSRLIERDKND
ncbi:MAG: hypothetical protein ACP5RP_00780 [Candidatus Micrarchaeia archaeon]